MSNGEGGRNLYGQCHHDPAPDKYLSPLFPKRLARKDDR